MRILTTEDFLQTLYDEGMRAYKRHRKNSTQARKLDRHEPIAVSGTEVSCWREFVMVKVAEHIQEVLPDADVRVVLDGNASYIDADLTDAEKVRLTGSLNSFFGKVSDMRGEK